MDLLSPPRVPGLSKEGSGDWFTHHSFAATRQKEIHLLPETNIGVAPIDGIDLAKIAAGQSAAALKQAQSQIEAQVRAATLDLYNLRTKRGKLLADVRAVDENITKAESRLERFKSGDWTALEPFELKDKAADKKDDKKEEGK